MSDFIEMRIIEGVKKLLTGRVNQIVEERQFVGPIIEFGNFGRRTVITPDVELTSCEQSEKERIIKLNVHFVTVQFKFDDDLDSELYCYSFSSAVEKALNEDVTLGGIADRAVISKKTFIPPNTKNCGEGWGLTLNLRITVEEMII